MSGLAKKMLEKYGWKEGEGLGKERTGIKSYVKVTRRDPHTATGLGHAADPSNGGSLASTHAVELDAIYGQLHEGTNKRRHKLSKTYPQGEGISGMRDDDDDDVSEASSDDREVVIRSSSSITEDKSEGESVPVATRTTVKRQRRVPSSSSEGSSDEDDCRKRSKNNRVGDVTRMSDDELLQRCGGVRLGRAGRHRFFDGKLKRIHESS